MFCSNCGKELPDGSKFCAECGTKLIDLSESTVVTEESKKQTNEKENGIMEESSVEVSVQNDMPKPENKSDIKFNKSDVKKIFYVVLTVIAAVILIKGIIGQINGSKSTVSNNSDYTTITSGKSDGKRDKSFDKVLKKAEAVEPGDTITIDGYGTLNFNKACTTDTIFSSLGSSLHYENKSANETYVDFVFTVTNETSASIDLDDFMSVRAKTNDGAEYSTASFYMDDDGGTSISAYGSISPLKEVLIHCAISVPTTTNSVAVIFDVNGNDYSYNYTVGQTNSNAQAISSGNTLTVNNFAELTFNGTEYTDDLLPSNTSGYYTHYQVDDASDTYYVVSFDVTNLQSTSKDIDTFVGATLQYNDKYNYNGFTVSEDADRKGLSAYNDIRPLGSAKLYILFKVPDQIQGEPGVLTITFGGQEYTYQVR